MWGGRGRCLEQRRVGKSSVYCLAASDYLPVRSSQVKPRRSTTQGEMQSHGVCLPTRAKAVIRKPWCKYTPPQAEVYKILVSSKETIEVSGTFSVLCCAEDNAREGQILWSTSCHSSLVRNNILPS